MSISNIIIHDISKTSLYQSADILTFAKSTGIIKRYSYRAYGSDPLAMKNNRCHMQIRIP